MASVLHAAPAHKIEVDPAGSLAEVIKKGTLWAAPHNGVAAGNMLQLVRFVDDTRQTVAECALGMVVSTKDSAFSFVQIGEIVETGRKPIPMPKLMVKSGRRTYRIEEVTFDADRYPGQKYATRDDAVIQKSRFDVHRTTMDREEFWQSFEHRHQAEELVNRAWSTSGFHFVADETGKPVSALYPTADEAMADLEGKLRSVQKGIAA